MKKKKKKIAGCGVRTHAPYREPELKSGALDRSANPARTYASRFFPSEPKSGTDNQRRAPRGLPRTKIVKNIKTQKFNFTENNFSYLFPFNTATIIKIPLIL